MELKFTKGPFIIYGRRGGGCCGAQILRGCHFFDNSSKGAHLFLTRKYCKKWTKHFLHIFWAKINRKHCCHNFFLRGALNFGKPAQAKSPPPPIHNERSLDVTFISLRVASRFHFHSLALLLPSSIESSFLLHQDCLDSSFFLNAIFCSIF